MIKYIILLLTLLSSCVFYRGTSELFEKNEIKNVQLKLDGYYYYQMEDDHIWVDGELIKIDSMQNREVSIYPIMLYKDGSAHRFAGISALKIIGKESSNEAEAYEECHRLFQESLSNNDGYYQYTWGIYIVSGDTIKIQMYRPEGAFPLPFTSRILEEMRGIIENDSTFTLFQFINHGNDYLDSLDEEYKFIPFETKLDSTEWDMDKWGGNLK